MSREVLTRELIGTKVKVVSSNNPSCQGIEGSVVDETRNILVIETKSGERKRLVKAHHKFAFEDDITSGKELAGRPEERIKRWLRARKST